MFLKVKIERHRPSTNDFRKLSKLQKFYEIQTQEEHVDCYPMLENLTGPMIRLDISLKQWEVNQTLTYDIPLPLRSVQNYW